MPPEHKLILCYVTDSSALENPQAPSAASPVSPSAPGRTAHTMVETIRRAAAAGVDWIQIREKNLETRALVELVRLAVANMRETKASVLVNDRLDIALAAGAAGVHLGEASVPVDVIAKWRRSAGRPGFRIGASCHSVAAALVAEHGGADYIFFGPVFATPSKAAFGAPQGIERLGEVCRALRIPVLAIGGVTLENAAACASAGAAGVAAIRLFQESEDLAATVTRLRS